MRWSMAETGFRQPGIMYLAETPAELGQLESWLEHGRTVTSSTRASSPMPRCES